MGGIGRWTGDIHCGDCRSVLAEMPPSSVHCVITSPPYYNLRDYQSSEEVWGGDETCSHDWETVTTPSQGGYNTDDNPANVGANRTTQETSLRGPGGIESSRCADCGAWRGALGLEPNVEQFVANIATVGERISTVLRDDGSWWLNLGDTFAKSKSKMLVPHRVAIALQDAGWIIRNDVVWEKSNPMPESATDRLSTTYEIMFHLVPQQDYYYDLDAIREPYAAETVQRGTRSTPAKTKGSGGYPGQSGQSRDEERIEQGGNRCGGKNPGDIIESSTSSFSDAHFAVMPEELVETPLKATCPSKVCANCGAAYTRIVEETERPEMRDRNVERITSTNDTEGNNNRGSWVGTPKDRETVGWQTGCDCATDETQPGIVLDPFAGAGTTCLVAKRLGRRFTGIDLNDEYVTLAQSRCGLTPNDPSTLRDSGEIGLETYTAAQEESQ